MPTLYYISIGLGLAALGIIMYLLKTPLEKEKTKGISPNGGASD